MAGAFGDDDSRLASMIDELPQTNTCYTLNQKEQKKGYSMSHQPGYSFRKTRI